MEKQLFLKAPPSRQRLGERVPLPTWHLRRLGAAPALSLLPGSCVREPGWNHRVLRCPNGRRRDSRLLRHTDAKQVKR